MGTLYIYIYIYYIISYLSQIFLLFFFFLRSKISTFINQARLLNQPVQIEEYLVALLLSRHLDFDSKLPS